MITRIQGITISRRHETSKVSKTLNVFFIILHVIFMLDFGYKSKSKNANNALKYFTLLQRSISTLLLFTVIVFDLYRFGAAYYYVYLFQYVLNVYILHFCDRKKTLYALLENLLFIDIELKYRKSQEIELTLIFYIVFALIIRVILSVISCLHFNVSFCNIYVFQYVLVFTVASGLHFSLFLYFFLFYSVYCRLKKLRNDVQNNISHILTYQYYYKFLINSTEKAKDVFDYLLMLILLIQVPELISVIYDIIKEIKFTLVDILHHLIVCVYGLEILMVIFLPAFFATMLTNEACKLKLELYDRLLSERGAANRDEIKQFIEYIDARPFQFYVCHVIPLNYKFPLIIINIYITYLISIAQVAQVTTTSI